MTDEYEKVLKEELACANERIRILADECRAWRSIGVRPLSGPTCPLHRAMQATDAAKALDEYPRGE
jgi:hypothetical protein